MKILRNMLCIGVTCLLAQLSYGMEEINNPDFGLDSQNQKNQVPNSKEEKEQKEARILKLVRKLNERDKNDPNSAQRASEGLKYILGLEGDFMRERREREAKAAQHLDDASAGPRNDGDQPK